MPVESLTSHEVDHKQIKKWEEKLSEEERARLALIEWRKDQKYDFKSPLIEYPQLGIGIGGIIAIVVGRALYYRPYQRKIARQYGKVEFSQYLVQTRISATSDTCQVQCVFHQENGHVKSV
ncbi:uncharacterized protein LOC125683729 [Ostrea edulis]|uniref:uncharacterized protein LOC125683729 n=1 Tax=Ostrea edulis TaxID=37623 RepID=UPI002096527A|nr:uncharacterized protein LOC125683729 [Ostrea edulis]XP_055996705.1 uncharacterized protein LOC125683729 [Ostrea edulis]